MGAKKSVEHANLRTLFDCLKNLENFHPKKKRNLFEEEIYGQCVNCFKN